MTAQAVGEHEAVVEGHVRRLVHEDEPLLRDHLLRLDEKSRFDRFAMAVSDDFLRNYAERCFGIDDVIYGFFVDGEMFYGKDQLRDVEEEIMARLNRADSSPTPPASVRC